LGWAILKLIVWSCVDLTLSGRLWQGSYREELDAEEHATGRNHIPASHKVQNWWQGEHSGVGQQP
jgi:hypothetical protein